MEFPVPAIVFLCVLCGCIIILCIVYQLLKRDMCCNFEAGLGEIEKATKNGYTELTEHFYDFDETEGPTTDDDPQSRKSSRRSSRRSSYDLTATSQSGGEMGVDSSSIYGGESIDIRISGPEDEAQRHAGKILFEFNYTPETQKLSVTVIKAADVPSKARGGSSAIQVRLVLLPTKGQRFKTKVRPASNPVFNETFIFMYVDQIAISQFQIRIRIYGQERYNQGRLIGELIQPLKELNLFNPATEENQVWKTLAPRALTSADSMYDLSDTTSVGSPGFGSPILGGSQSSLTGHSSAPELLISLCYASLTGRLTVEVLKASNLRHLQLQRAPDSYVKIEVLSARGKRVAKSKTTIRRSMTDPEFNESFVFQMSESDLQEVTLVFSVICISKTRKKKDVLGWFTMGKEANSLDEIDHWEEMIAHKEQKSTHYHVLLQA
ncbi:synaptotagmin-16-like isoform X4 [Clytia hemisphaerica]|uniref:C2 domain-containing protein n=1 Tax=Clytia hemisphaerica TaxID=252671 RepID=A0A7M5V632_9CNID